MKSQITKRMLQLGVRKEDIEENFIRSRAPGGSNVNKVATCVQLKHLPTGIAVKCAQQRTQAQNRSIALALLLDKIEAAIEKEKRFQEFLRQKELRKERKRSKALKERILEKKRRRAEIKRSRAKIYDLEQ